MYDIVIIGSGVAGLTAGIYGGRANKKVLIIEDNNLGGTTSTLIGVTNFPGYVEVDGIDLITNMQMQCVQFGVDFEFATISKIDFDISKITLQCDRIIEYKTLIIACGSTNNKLGVLGEDKYKFKGLSYCAICDGNLYKNKKIVVFTNGNSANNEINYLCNLTKDIIVCDISDMYDNVNVKVYQNVKPIEIMGDEIVRSVTIEVNGEREQIYCDGVFVHMGKCTDLHLYEGKINIENNQIVSDENMHTNLENVFVAGDVRKKSLKQIITACADGAIASSEAIKYLSNNK